MEPIRCFMLEETDRAANYLRRYTYAENGPCPIHGAYGHDASTRIEDGEIELTGRGSFRSGGDDFDHADPRWPIVCECGYLFQNGDAWLHIIRRIYTRQDTGEQTTLREVGAGAMWYAPWYEPEWAGPDGRALMVKLPKRHEWLIDGPSTSGGAGWTREGTPPNVTANPSINAGTEANNWHGWLRNGFLVDA